MKKTIIISFSAPKGTDFSKLFAALKAYKTWAKITRNTWAIVTEKKASEVRDEVIKLLPKDSRTIVVKSGSVAAWRNVICSSEWLKKNL